MRKHFQQMTSEERAFVHGFIRANVTRLRGAPHFYDRASDRRFSFVEALDAVRCGLAIEVHNDVSSDVRALVRNKKGTCVVISLVSWDIITVFYNAPEDKHETLNWSPYRWSVNLVDVVKSLRKAA